MYPLGAITLRDAGILGNISLTCPETRTVSPSEYEDLLVFTKMDEDETAAPFAISTWIFAILLVFT